MSDVTVDEFILSLPQGLASYEEREVYICKLVLDACEAGDVSRAAFLQERVLPRLKEIAASGGETEGRA